MHCYSVSSNFSLHLCADSLEITLTEVACHRRSVATQELSALTQVALNCHTGETFTGIVFLPSLVKMLLLVKRSLVRIDT
jgi:hypothetical protein